MTGQEVGDAPIARKRIKGFFLDLMISPHYTPILPMNGIQKNEPLQPSEVTARNNRIVWWKCPQGHEWQARIADRTGKLHSGCPYCSGRKVIQEITDLQVVRPEIAQEWHPTKNGDLKPTGVTANSHKTIWWRCPKGHEWQATIHNRVGNNSGCPICAMESHTSFPEQAIGFYLEKITPTEQGKVIEGKECDVYLSRLNCGIEYDGMAWHRGAEKLEKDHRKEVFLKNHLDSFFRIREVPGTKNPQINNGIIDYDPKRKYSDLSKVIQLIIDRAGLDGKSVDVDLERDRFDIYVRYSGTKKLSSIEVLYPALAREWHPTKNGDLKPTDVTAGSRKMIWWRCSLGHDWVAAPNNRTSAGSGCPYCSGRRVLPGFNDLATKRPDLAREWHPTKNGDLKPTDVTANSHKTIWWRCSKGHEWQATPNQRVSSRKKCPQCRR